jgi:uncharacterized protein YlxW (UPF0749 family)
LALGLFFTAQLQSKPAPPMDVDYPRHVAAATIEQLEAEQTVLKQEIADLRRQIKVQQEQAARDKAAFAEISASLRQEQLTSGLAALAGPGVKVTLDDSTSKTIPAGQEENYIVHEYDLRDVLNVLWASGAEAVSLNDERIVATTSIYCVGSTILVNNTRLSPPYVFHAIGDPESLAAGLREQTALPMLKHRVQNYSIQYRVEVLEEVTVPAFNGTLQVRYAQPAAAKK